jgi:hypothetical protein
MNLTGVARGSQPENLLVVAGRKSSFAQWTAEGGCHHTIQRLQRFTTYNTRVRMTLRRIEVAKGK